MKIFTRFCVVVIIVYILFLGWASDNRVFSGKKHEVARDNDLDLLFSMSAISRIPLRSIFVENVGQFPGEVQFQALDSREALWVTKEGFWITVKNDSASIAKDLYTQNPITDRPSQILNIKVSFTSNRALRVRALRKLPFYFNYFKGRERSDWYVNVPAWNGIRYENVCPGIDIDLMYSGKDIFLILANVFKALTSFGKQDPP